MYATPKVKFVFDRRKRASKTTNGAIEIEVCFAGQRVSMGHKTKRVKRDGSVDGESLLISAR